MGNFYTNIVLRETDVDRVVSAVEGLRRRGYVVSADNASVVYDERCDEQDLDELRKLAGKLSARLGGPALAFCNHDDDVLWYALAEGGKVVDTYDSCPGYFDGGSTTPEGGDAARLCAAFGVDDRRSDVDALLRQEKEAITFEVDRHEKLLGLLRLPKLALLGYRYVSEGELSNFDGEGAQVRSVGGAPPLVVKSAASSGARAVPSIDPAALAAMQAEGATMLGNTAALAFSRVAVPEKFAGMLPPGPINGHAILTRIQRYIVANHLGSPMGMVTPDDALSAIVGKDPFVLVALPRLVREAFAVPPLSDTDQSALAKNSPAFHAKFFAALAAAAKEAQD